ncbi:hypothetical protein BaRGS_00028644, partial [Batillaria attramentaria]
METQKPGFQPRVWGGGGCGGCSKEGEALSGWCQSAKGLPDVHRSVGCPLTRPPLGLHLGGYLCKDLLWIKGRSSSVVRGFSKYLITLVFDRKVEAETDTLPCP